MVRVLKDNRFNVIVTLAFVIVAYLSAHNLSAHNPSNFLNDASGAAVLLPIGYFFASFLGMKQRALLPAAVLAIVYSFVWSATTVAVSLFCFPSVYDIHLGPCGF